MLRQAGVTESYVSPLICATAARAALRRGDVTETRSELVHAQRSRPLLTYAVPHIAVQARIELARVHLDLADLPVPGRCCGRSMRCSGGAPASAP